MGGGSGSGAISHSAYMEAQHKAFLNSGVTRNVTVDIVEAMNAAFLPSSNPFSGSFAYSPDADLTANANSVVALKVLIDALNYTGDTSTAINTLSSVVVADTDTLITDTLDVFVIDEALVKADVLAYSASLESDLTDLTIPKFKASMLNIGATIGSGFILGEAILRKEKLRQIAVFEADLRQKLQLQANEINARFKIQHKDKTTELQIKHAVIVADFKNQRRVNLQGFILQALQNLMRKSELEIELARYTLETNRLKIIAKTEQAKENLLIREHDRKWNLEVFQYGTSLLGGIGSGTLVPGKKSQAVSALAGALGGAAVGASIPGAGPAGAIGGGIIGAIGGLLG